jgi:glycerol kinase
MTRHVLAIDQGTTGSTCLMIGANGDVVGRGYREITQHFPRPGWVEHDAKEIVERTVDAAREAIEQAGVLPEALGITNQRETVVMWDRSTGEPVGRAIVWQDRRTAPRCAELATRSDWFAKRTGLVVDPYFSATKLEWMLEANPALARRAMAGELAAGTIDAWLVWTLTGGRVHATDPTNASRTLLFDIRTLGWSTELCGVFDIPMALLPEVRPSAGDFGSCDPSFFGAAVPITGIAGDQQAALFGQGCWKAGEGKNTYGTGAFLLLNTGATCPAAGAGVLTTVACDAGGAPAYAMEGAIFIAGAALQWLRDGLGILRTASESEALARSLESNDGVYFVPALVGLGAPHWEPNARGAIVGLTRGTTGAHLARAALEAMAYSTADVAAVMQRRAGVQFERLRVDGGAALNDWFMQYQADLLDIPVERPDMVETTALGAAGLAGIAAGIWPDAAHFLETREYARFTPGPGATAAREAVRGWHRAVRATLAWARDVE